MRNRLIHFRQSHDRAMFTRNVDTVAMVKIALATETYDRFSQQA
jgi:hypothetical protein